MATGGPGFPCVVKEACAFLGKRYGDRWTGSAPALSSGERGATAPAEGKRGDLSLISLAGASGVSRCAGSRQAT